MIPTLILFGLLFGRWWRSALVAAALGWSILLLAEGMELEWDLGVGAGLAVLNAGVGVLVHQVVLWTYRWWRRRREAGRTPR